MSCAQIAMMAGLRYTALRDAIVTHPTLAEGLITLLSSPSTPGPAAANIGGRQERPSNLVPTATSRFRLVGNITASKDLLREISARDERW